MEQEQNKSSIFAKIFGSLSAFVTANRNNYADENESLVAFGTQTDPDAEYKHEDDGQKLTKEDIMQICTSIDVTNETIHDWYEKGKPADVAMWGAQHIRELAEEINPDMTEEQRANLDKEISKGVDAALIEQARGLADDIAGSGNEITDEEMQEIENQVKKEEE